MTVAVGAVQTEFVNTQDVRLNPTWSLPQGLFFPTPFFVLGTEKADSACSARCKPAEERKASARTLDAILFEADMLMTRHHTSQKTRAEHDKPLRPIRCGIGMQHFKSHTSIH